MSSNLPSLLLSLVNGTLALEDLDEHRVLVVGGSREDLRLLGGHDGVTGDELGHDTAVGLDTEGEGG